MSRHFLLVKDAENWTERHRFQANGLGNPEVEAIAAAMRKLHRTNKNIEIRIYKAEFTKDGGWKADETPDGLIGRAAWDLTGTEKTFVRPSCLSDEE